MAHTELPRERGRRPQRLHRKGRHGVSRSRTARPHNASRRPAHRHSVPQHLSSERDRQGGGGDMRGDRELQRLTCRTDIRRVREHGVLRTPARTQHPGTGGTPPQLHHGRRAAVHIAPLPTRQRHFLCLRRHRLHPSGEGSRTRRTRLRTIAPDADRHGKHAPATPAGIPSGKENHTHGHASGTCHDGKGRPHRRR